VGISAERVGDSNAENHVCTLGITILGDVLPFFFVCVFLRFVPLGACGEVKDARVRGPGESMDFFFALRNRERLAAGGLDNGNLVGGVSSFGVAVGCLL